MLLCRDGVQVSHGAQLQLAVCSPLREACHPDVTDDCTVLPQGGGCTRLDRTSRPPCAKDICLAHTSLQTPAIKVSAHVGLQYAVNPLRSRLSPLRPAGLVPKISTSCARLPQQQRLSFFGHSQCSSTKAIETGRVICMTWEPAPSSIAQGSVRHAGSLLQQAHWSSWSGMFRLSSMSPRSTYCRCAGDRPACSFQCSTCGQLIRYVPGFSSWGRLCDCPCPWQL